MSEGSSRGFLRGRPEFSGRLCFVQALDRLQTAVLTGKQRRHLRGLGHDLKPIVQIGKDGIDEGVVAAVERALLDHELVKIKIGEAAGLERHDAAEAIADRTHSEVAQVLGNTVLLYRAHPDEPQIVLPAP